MRMITLDNKMVYQGYLVLVDDEHPLNKHYQVKYRLYQDVNLEETTLKMLKKVLDKINSPIKIIFSNLNKNEIQSGLCFNTICLNNEVYCQFKNIALEYGFIERHNIDKENNSISCFCYVGNIISYLINQKQWSFEEFHLYIKSYTLYHPYIFRYRNKIIEIFYVPVESNKTRLFLSEKRKYKISGNNHDGFIIYAWRNYG